jgi:hypothetical protein
MLSLVPSAVALGLAALGALYLAQGRRSPVERRAEGRAASRMLAVATLFQALHFGEELGTGFRVRFGDLFGLGAMPLWLFVAFNLTWIGFWIASVWWARSGRRFAFFAAWFLAIAGTLNGVAHPLMAVARDGYFPGLVSALPVAAASLWLSARLWHATEWVGAAAA